jgi:hypothetical protein
VGVSRRIDDKPRRLLGARLLDPIDDLAFVIGLAKFHRKPVPFRRRAAEPLDVAERGTTIDLRLARAEQIEIGSV